MNGVTFERADTSRDRSEWFVDVNGEYAGDLIRERPTRWHGNGCSGIVYDRESAYLWSFISVAGATLDIPAGSTAREAKALVRAVLSCCS